MAKAEWRHIGDGLQYKQVLFCFYLNPGMAAALLKVWQTNLSAALFPSCRGTPGVLWHFTHKNLTSFIWLMCLIMLWNVDGDFSYNFNFLLVFFTQAISLQNLIREHALQQQSSLDILLFLQLMSGIVFFHRLMLRNKADRATRALLCEISRDNVDFFISFELTRNIPIRASSVDSSKNVTG